MIGAVRGVARGVAGALWHRSVIAAHGVLHGVLSRLPRNGVLWSYTIHGADGSPYVTRTLLPRVLGHRVLVHRIWREDRDPWHHNHPWSTAAFLILCGGYAEVRRDRLSGADVVRHLAPGSVNVIGADDFHRVAVVVSATVTVGVVGERCQEWGFLVDGEGLVLSEDYFARRSYRSSRGIT